jgi:fibronectin type 3 domain-containing protein
MMLNRGQFHRVFAWRAGLAAGLLLIGGCASSGGYGDGRHDVREYDGLKLSMSLPPPGGVALEGGGLRSIDLKWPAPAEKIYRYRIERADAIEGPFQFVAYVDPAQRGYTDGRIEGLRLKDSTTYFYQVTAVLTADGPRSLPCKVMSATTGPPPGAVRDLRVQASGSRKSSLSWSAAEGAGTLTYRIERAPADRPESFASLGTTGENIFVDGGTTSSTLADSTEYRYRVVTLNEVGAESPPSAAVSVVTLPPPEPVKGLEGTSGEVRCAPLKWQPSPEMDVIEYHIFFTRSPDEPFVRLTTVPGRTTATYLHGGANPGDLEDEAAYYYRVSAVNAVGSVSAPGETVKVVTRQIPPVVTGVAVESARPREVPVSWKPSADTAVTGYEIWRALEGEDEWQQIKVLQDAQAARYLDRGGVQDPEKLGGLLDGTNYLYRVIAFNAGGVRSSASAPVTARTKVVPATPANLRTISGLAGVVKMSWSANPEPDIRGYRVEASSRADRSFRELSFHESVAGTQLYSAEESGLKVAVTRYYRVKAYDLDGLESLWCDAVSAVTKELPDAPASLRLTDSGETDAVLKWNPSTRTDIAKYNVWSGRIIGWKLLGESRTCEFVFDKAGLKDISTLAVTAVDVDGLESEKSETIKQELIGK